ncbi:MAG: hypothetical protein WKF37_15810 [Bryobacteraceae bacterium]
MHRKRKKPKKAIQTFAGKTLQPEDYEEVTIDTEDFGAVLVHLGDRARGAFTVSQVNAGCKNRFQMESSEPDAGWCGIRNALTNSGSAIETARTRSNQRPFALTRSGSGFADAGGNEG